MVNFSISKVEQEVLINFNAAEKMASIWTQDPVFIRKLDKLCIENPEQFKSGRESKVNGRVVGKFYECDKKLISIRSKSIKREMTEEQKKMASERMKKINSKRQK